MTPVDAALRVLHRDIEAGGPLADLLEELGHNFAAEWLRGGSGLPSITAAAARPPH